MQSSQKIRDIFIQLQITINLEAGPWGSIDEIVGTVRAPSERNASEADLTINLNSTLKKVEAALRETVIFGANRAPSEFEIKIDLTINWKSAIEVEATINLNAWRVVGANCASSKIDLPINLRDKLGVILCVLFDLRGLARTVNREAQLDSFELRHLARATNRAAQLDSFELRHLACTTLEAQLDSRELRHLARATLEAQLDSCELRHLECTANR